MKIMMFFFFVVLFCVVGIQAMQDKKEIGWIENIWENIGDLAVNDEKIEYIRDIIFSHVPGVKESFQCCTKKRYSFPLPENSLISLKNTNGRTIVFGRDDSYVPRLIIEKKGINNEALYARKLKINYLKDQLEVKVSEDHTGASVLITYYLFVSNKKKYQYELQNYFGDTIVINTKGSVRAHSLSGDVYVSKSDGDVGIKSFSGNIFVDTVFKSVKINTILGKQNIKNILGSLTLIGHTGDVNVSGVDGDCNVISNYGEIFVAAINLLGSLSVRSKTSDIKVCVGEYVSKLSIGTISSDITLFAPKNITSVIKIQKYSDERQKNLKTTFDLPTFSTKEPPLFLIYTMSGRIKTNTTQEG